MPQAGVYALGDGFTSTYIPGRLDMTSGSGAGIVEVFGSSQSQPGDGDYELGVEVGRLLAEAGYSVTNGGYGGLMEAASVGASQAGEMSLGSLRRACSQGGAVATTTSPMRYPLPA